eukprot:3250035-Pyramimonas_sp.AAC.1
MSPLERSVSQGGLGHWARLSWEAEEAFLGVLQDLAPSCRGLEALPPLGGQRIVNLLDLLAGEPVGHLVV